MKVTQKINIAFGIAFLTIISLYLCHTFLWPVADKILFGSFASLLIILFVYTREYAVKRLTRLKEVAPAVLRGKGEKALLSSTKDEYGEIYESLYSMGQNLSKATHFIKSIERGDLETEITFSEELLNEDGLGTALINMREHMKRMSEEEKERNWANEGMAKFVEILRMNSDDTEKLGYNIISNLTKYLNANQAGLFIVNEDEGEKVYLNMVACYAYNKQKFIDNKISIGQGLLGQAYLEKETIYLTTVPKDYISITSGLGEATPGYLIIIPLKLNNEVFGLVEIASFHPFKKYMINFLEKLGESIASSIAYVQTYKKTQNLLTLSIEQSENLKAQEEEMRQNLEELEATQEEMRRNALELERVKLEEAARADAIIAEQKRKLQEQMDEIEASNEILKQKSIEVQKKAEEAEKAKEIAENQKKMLERQMEKARKSQEEIQQNYQQLQAVEEELRQNMEEIHATQEALLEKNQELEKISKEEAKAKELVENQKKIMIISLERLKKKEEHLKEENEDLRKTLDSINIEMETLRASLGKLHSVNSQLAEKLAFLETIQKESEQKDNQ